jgi:hypothetical protein
MKYGRGDLRARIGTAHVAGLLCMLREVGGILRSLTMALVALCVSENAVIPKRYETRYNGADSNCSDVSSVNQTREGTRSD